MRKLVFAIGFFVSLFFFLTAQTTLPVSAQEANTCAESGGECKISCPPNEYFIGQRDCSGREARCCVSTPREQVEESIECTINGKSGIDTAIGCIPIGNTNDFLGFFLGWAIGIGGGIAFLLIVLAGFQISTSSGNPERLKAGQELLTSAVAGLIMLIFSVFILRVIGVDILKLPGLN